jgi:hypothetical protein
VKKINRYPIRAVSAERLSSSALHKSAAQFLNSKGDGVLFVYVDFMVSIEGYDI